MAADTTQTPSETAVLGGGCFWCLDAVFSQLQGVVSVESGYAGGHVESPTYEQVCGKQTGHAEVVRVEFDPSRTSYANLLEVFFKIHDPTTKDRQGADEGPQYRSVIYTTTEAQLAEARDIVAGLTREGVWPDPIVTEIAPLPNYYPAEDYHQDYFAKNPDKGYCAMVVRPKVEKFKKAFADRLNGR